MTALRFNTWAQPVTSRPWAVVSVVAWHFQRLTGHRLGTRFTHRAWLRACGLD